jgi:hypothetical protein
LKIGIALAVFRPNPEYFLTQLKSIESQTYADWVCVVTSDSPLKDLFRYPNLRRYRRNHRFHWYQNSMRLGVKKNFERAIQLCLKEKVSAIACSDQDDVWYPHKLTRSIQVFQKISPMGMVHSDMKLLESTKKKGPMKFPQTLWEMEARGVHQSQPHHLLIRSVVNGCTMLFDAELARRYPVIPDGFLQHDQWFPFVASLHGGVHPIHEPLSAYRLHEKNVSGMTPYRGLLNTQASPSFMGLLKKCRRLFFETRTMALTALKMKMPLSGWTKFILLFPLDLGLGLFLLGLRHSLAPRGRDLSLARACFARAIGKALFFMPER